MKHPPFKHLLSLLFCAGIGFVLVPSCTIRIGPPSDESTSASAENSPPELPPTHQPSAEQAAELFAKADPYELALVTVKTSYALYLVNGSIEAEGLAPESLDEETLKTLVDKYLPWAMDEAETWSSTVEPSMLVSSVGKPPPWNPDCPTAFGCPEWLTCWSLKRDSSINCYPTDCGDSRCKPCPEWFGGFAKLAIKAWCSYACVGMDGKVAGGAGVVISSFKLFKIPFCYLDGVFRAPL